jgi:hypothetical protein
MKIYPSYPAEGASQGEMEGSYYLVLVTGGASGRLIKSIALKGHSPLFSGSPIRMRSWFLFLGVLKMSKPFKITVLDGDEQPWLEFPSITQFGQHLGASESRIRLKLKGKHIISTEDYIRLQQWVYQPITRGHYGSC